MGSGDDIKHPTANSYPNRSRSFHRGVVQSPGGTYRADHHPNNRGNFAFAAAAYMELYRRDIRQSGYYGQGSGSQIDANDARMIKRVVYETVAEGLMPDTTSRLEFAF